MQFKSFCDCISTGQFVGGSQAAESLWLEALPGDEDAPAQYTKAQIINMLKRSGRGNLPDTILILMARHEVF